MKRALELLPNTKWVKLASSLLPSDSLSGPKFTLWIWLKTLISLKGLVKTLPAFFPGKLWLLTNLFCWQKLRPPILVMGVITAFSTAVGGNHLDHISILNWIWITARRKSDLNFGFPCHNFKEMFIIQASHNRNVCSGVVVEGTYAIAKLSIGALTIPHISEEGIALTAHQIYEKEAFSCQKLEQITESW